MGFHTEKSSSLLPLSQWSTRSFPFFFIGVAVALFAQQHIPFRSRVSEGVELGLRRAYWSS